MTTHRSRSSAPLAAVALAVAAAWFLAAAAPEAQKIKYETQHDKTVDFSTMKTWNWDPSGTGEVKLALTAQSDPERVKRLVDPVIVAAVEKEMAAKGLRKVAEKPDLFVTYWLIGTIGESSQQMGEFLPAVPEWGLPVFYGETQSLRTYPVGTLLLDLLKGKDLVWRGEARSEVNLDKTPAERKQRIENAVHQLISKFPPKK